MEGQIEVAKYLKGLLFSDIGQFKPVDCTDQFCSYPSLAICAHTLWKTTGPLILSTQGIVYGNIDR